MQSALGIHKTEVAPLSVDLTEMNKQKNKCIHSKRERERETHLHCDARDKEKELGASVFWPGNLLH